MTLQPHPVASPTSPHPPTRSRGLSRPATRPAAHIRLSNKKEAPLRCLALSVVIGVRRRGHVNWFVIEFRNFDAIGTSQFENLVGPSDAREVRPVANLSPVAFELCEKLFGPGNFIL